VGCVSAREPGSEIALVRGAQKVGGIEGDERHASVGDTASVV
jgi:hypothetical protein